jgi:hypothetical protein
MEHARYSDPFAKLEALVVDKYSWTCNVCTSVIDIQDIQAELMLGTTYIHCLACQHAGGTSYGSHILLSDPRDMIREDGPTHEWDAVYLPPLWPGYKPEVWSLPRRVHVDKNGPSITVSLCLGDLYDLVEFTSLRGPILENLVASTLPHDPGGG